MAITGGRTQRNGTSKRRGRTRFSSVAIRDALLKMGLTEGWPQNLERLAKLPEKF